MEQRNMDYHLHTLHSPDAEQSVDELCQTALARGVQEICLTEHMDLGHPDPINAVPPLMDAYRQDVNDARRRYLQLTIRMGLEIGDIPQTREETHRFAIEYQRALRNEGYVSALDKIEGVGPKRRSELMKYFKTVRAVKEADVDRLRLVVPKNTAQKIYDCFHNEEENGK